MVYFRKFCFCVVQTEEISIMFSGRRRVFSSSSSRKQDIREGISTHQRIDFNYEVQTQKLERTTRWELTRSHSLGSHVG